MTDTAAIVAGASTPSRPHMGLFERYLTLWVARARLYLGRSPAGGAMVIALLVFLAATVSTGLVAYGDRGKGPLAGAGGTAITLAGANDEDTQRRDTEARGNGSESVLGELHGTLANITLALVILHMINGQKRTGQ